MGEHDRYMKKRDHLGVPAMHEKLRLQWSWREQDIDDWNGFMWLTRGVIGEPLCTV